MEKSAAATLIQNAWRNYALSYCYRCDIPMYTRKYVCRSCHDIILEIEEANRKWSCGKGPYPKERLHYCNNYFCSGDCGLLACGCIDICRGRCGRCGRRRERW